MKMNPNNKGLIVEVRFVGNGDGTFRGDKFNVYIPAQPQHGLKASATYWCTSLVQVPTKLKQALAAQHVKYEPMLTWGAGEWLPNEGEEDSV